jgi:hypothetical protein
MLLVYFEIKDQNGFYFTLVELPGGDNRTFRILVGQIGHEYHGHCNPRFVTETARQAFYAALKR